MNFAMNLTWSGRLAILRGQNISTSSSEPVVLVEPPRSAVVTPAGMAFRVSAYAVTLDFRAKRPLGMARHGHCGGVGRDVDQKRRHSRGETAAADV